MEKIFIKKNNLKQAISLVFISIFFLYLPLAIGGSSPDEVGVSDPKVGLGIKAPDVNNFSKITCINYRLKDPAQCTQEIIDKFFKKNSKFNIKAKCDDSLEKGISCCIKPDRCTNIKQQVRKYTTGLVFEGLKVASILQLYSSKNIQQACKLRNIEKVSKDLLTPLTESVMGKSCSDGVKICNAMCATAHDKFIQELDNCFKPNLEEAPEASLSLVMEGIERPLTLPEVSKSTGESIIAEMSKYFKNNTAVNLFYITENFEVDTNTTICEPSASSISVYISKGKDVLVDYGETQKQHLTKIIKAYKSATKDKVEGEQEIDVDSDINPSSLSHSEFIDCKQEVYKHYTGAQRTKNLENLKLEFCRQAALNTPKNNLTPPPLGPKFNRGLIDAGDGKTTGGTLGAPPTGALFSEPEALSLDTVPNDEFLLAPNKFGSSNKDVGGFGDSNNSAGGGGGGGAGGGGGGLSGGDGDSSIAGGGYDGYGESFLGSDGYSGGDGTDYNNGGDQKSLFGGGSDKRATASTVNPDKSKFNPKKYIPALQADGNIFQMMSYSIQKYCRNKIQKNCL